MASFRFLDETSLRLTYARTQGRTVGGQRVAGAVPLRRGPSRALIGALSVHGLWAMKVLKGALTQRSFALYVAHCLVPTLRPGDILMPDNLPVHKIGGLREWLAERRYEMGQLSVG